MSVCVCRSAQQDPWRQAGQSCAGQPLAGVPTERARVRRAAGRGNTPGASPASQRRAPQCMACRGEGGCCPHRRAPRQLLARCRVGGRTVLPAAAVLTPLQRSVAQPRRRRRAAWPPRARRRLQQACVVRTCEELGDVVRHQCIQQGGLGGGQRAPQRCPHNSAAIQPAVRGQGAGCIVNIWGQGLPIIDGGMSWQAKCPLPSSWIMPT